MSTPLPHILFQLEQMASLPVTKLPQANLGLAWKRLYAMMEPMSQAKKGKILSMQLMAIGSWPALAWFGHTTMTADYPEHMARHALVNKSMPYMSNPANIQYKWGTPCTLFDYDCSYAHRKSKAE